jgi:hypothetical protein
MNLVLSVNYLRLLNKSYVYQLFFKRTNVTNYFIRYNFCLNI